MVNLVRSFSSLWSLISTTNKPHVTLRPLGIFDLRINLFVFVLYSLLISFAVDRIHLILYLIFVMSSWCLSDLPVSGHITAFAISGMTMIFSLLMTFFYCWCWGSLGKRNKDWLDLLFLLSCPVTNCIFDWYFISP
jgi:hypothetical protein